MAGTEGGMPDDMPQSRGFTAAGRRRLPGRHLAVLLVCCIAWQVIGSHAGANSTGLISGERGGERWE